MRNPLPEEINNPDFFFFFGAEGSVKKLKTKAKLV